MQDMSVTQRQTIVPLDQDSGAVGSDSGVREETQLKVCGGSPAIPVQTSSPQQGGLQETPIAKRQATQPSSPAMPLFNLPDLTTCKALVTRLAREQGMDESTLDDESVYSMASALYAADIKTIEEAHRFKLVIVPPGPVFHTWYAMHGTTLFNGTNNVKGYDYVEMIKKEAEYLQQFHLPVLLVYSTLNMTAEQTEEMQKLFQESKNIISICLETDFPEHPMTSSLGEQEEGISRVDYIRYAVLLHRQEILEKSLEKAESTGKKQVVENLQSRKNRSLVYSDIDHVLIRPNLYMLSGPGFIPCFHPKSILYIKKWEERENIPANRPDVNWEEVQAHNNIVRHVWYQRQDPVHDASYARLCRDKLHSALLSGYIQDNLGRWYSYPLEQKHGLFAFEVNYFRVGSENTSEIEMGRIQESGREIFEKFNEHNTDRLTHDQKKMSVLLGMQQLKSHLVNYHNSWDSENVTEQKPLPGANCGESDP